MLAVSTCLIAYILMKGSSLLEGLQGALKVARSGAISPFRQSRRWRAVHPQVVHTAL